MTPASIEVIIYDTNPAGIRSGKLDPAAAVQQAGLLSTWVAGAALFKLRSRGDVVAIGATSWNAALARTVQAAATRGVKISKLSIWGHGSPGRAFLGKDELNSVRLRSDPAAMLERLRNVLAEDAYVWFRSCSIFAGTRGHTFAWDATRAFGCDVVGHTYTVGAWQSGGHALRLGERPYWNPSEGVARGTPSWPTAFRMSSRSAPNTVFATTANPPTSWWREEE